MDTDEKLNLKRDNFMMRYFEDDSCGKPWVFYGRTGLRFDSVHDIYVNSVTQLFEQIQTSTFENLDLTLDIMADIHKALSSKILAGKLDMVARQKYTTVIEEVLSLIIKKLNEKNRIDNGMWSFFFFNVGKQVNLGIELAAPDFVGKISTCTLLNLRVQLVNSGISSERVAEIMNDLKVRLIYEKTVSIKDGCGFDQIRLTTVQNWLDELYGDVEVHLTPRP